jgi:hypothetical protein
MKRALGLGEADTLGGSAIAGKKDRDDYTTLYLRRLNSPDRVSSTSKTKA